MSDNNGMISDEAVEAAAKYLGERFFWNGSLLNEVAREVLEAAAPHIKAYPHSSGDCTVIGPECFTNEPAEVICYKGVNYYRSQA